MSGGRDGGGLDWRRLHGRPTPPDRPLALRAGPLTALLDGPDLRHVRVGGVELVQRVYIAVRDAPWNTIPAVYSAWQRDVGDDRFLVTFHARHRDASIDVEWDGRIEGRPDGTITYEMDGVCHGVFQYSKIGVNVHHDLPGSIGRPYRARHGERTWTGVLPVAIAPQRIVDGTLSGMFDPYEELAIEVIDGLEAVVALEGDLLELQDHRNWIDANFKSYGTPLALGFPFDSADGQRIRQVLTIGYRGEPPSHQEGPATIRIGARLGHAMPPMGVALASDGVPLTEAELARLAAIGPAHLRVDLDLRPDDPLADLDRAAHEAVRPAAALELAVHVPTAADAALAALAERLTAIAVPIARVIVYPLADGFSALGALASADLVLSVEAALRAVIGDAPVVGGTEQSFADTNRAGPPDPRVAGVAFAMSPTVHAADDASIVENVVGAGEVVRAARALARGRLVVVSPVTLATRFGPYPGGPAAPGDLPPAVDARQATSLGAAWTAATIGQLARSGAASVTWYETAGWRGLTERDTGSPMPERFPSDPGVDFPLAAPLAMAMAARGAAVLDLEPSDPLELGGFAVDDGGRRLVVVANLTPAPIPARLEGLPAGAGRLRRTGSPGDPRSVEIGPSGTLDIELEPYGIADLEI